MKVQISDAYETDQYILLIIGMSWEAWCQVWRKSSIFTQTRNAFTVIKRDIIHSGRTKPYAFARSGSLSGIHIIPSKSPMVAHLDFVGITLGPSLMSRRLVEVPVPVSDENRHPSHGKGKVE